MTYDDLKNEIKRQLDIYEILQPEKIVELGMNPPRPGVSIRFFSFPDMEGLDGFVDNDVVIRLVDANALPKFMENIGDHVYLFAKNVNKCIEAGLISEQNIINQILDKEPALLGFMLIDDYVEQLKEINGLSYREKSALVNVFNKLEELGRKLTLTDFIFTSVFAHMK